MNEKQKESLTLHLSLECKVGAKSDARECDEGPWCEARKSIAEAFGLDVPKLKTSEL